MVCAAALSGCKGQRVVAGDATAPATASMPAAAESPSPGSQKTDEMLQSVQKSKPMSEAEAPIRTEVK